MRIRSFKFLFLLLLTIINIYCTLLIIKNSLKISKQQTQLRDLSENFR